MYAIWNFAKDRPYTFIWKLVVIFLVMCAALYLFWYKYIFAPKYINPQYYTGIIVSKVEGKNRSDLNYLVIKWDRDDVYGSVSTGPVNFYQYKVGDRIGVGYKWHPILKLVHVGDVPNDPKLLVPIMFCSIFYMFIFYGSLAIITSQLIMWYSDKIKAENRPSK